MVKTLSLLILGFTLILCENAHAEETAERTDKGYVVNRDHYLNIPKDMKVEKVGSNVITTEPDVTYLARRLDDQEQKLNEISSRLNTLEDKLNASPSPKP